MLSEEQIEPFLIKYEGDGSDDAFNEMVVALLEAQEAATRREIGELFRSRPIYRTEVEMAKDKFQALDRPYRMIYQGEVEKLLKGEAP